MTFRTPVFKKVEIHSESQKNFNTSNGLANKDRPIQVSSKIRVNSEPTKDNNLSLDKSYLPEIDGLAKRPITGAFPNQLNGIRRSKVAGFDNRGKSSGRDKSPPQINKFKKDISMDDYGNYYAIPIQKTPLKAARGLNISHNKKILDDSVHSAKKSASILLGFTPPSLMLKSQKSKRPVSIEKSPVHELSEITSSTKPKPRSNLNLLLKKLNKTPQPDNLSTSFNFINPTSIQGTKCSTKKNGVIDAYAANSNQGIVRNYNEDRVSIILNVTKPPYIDYKGEWPSCSFFAVYDGHGGSSCADFLKEALHQFIITNKNFPGNPIEAITQGFKEAENKFTKLAQKDGSNIDHSGSCAIIALIIDKKCYIANVGDSRAFMSSSRGKQITPLSRDHKPSDENEQDRILRNGGKLYQTPVAPQGKSRLFSGSQDYADNQYGPLRVLPGRLSVGKQVSRTFGDIEAKLEKYGGNPKVVIADPEIKTIEITEDSDFIVLASDGIFDRLSNQEVCDTVWRSTKQRCISIHEQVSQAAESVIIEALLKKTFDNITVVLLAFSGFKAGPLITKVEKKEQTTIHFPYDIIRRPKININNVSNKSNSQLAESSGTLEIGKTQATLAIGNNQSFSKNSDPPKSNFASAPVSKTKDQSNSRQLSKAYRRTTYSPAQKI